VTESKQGRERDPITIRACVCVCVCVKVPKVVERVYLYYK